MKERGIIFNDAMVRAILSGKKTQTRRVMKQQPPKHWCPVKSRGVPELTARTYTQGVFDRHGCLQAGPEVFGVADEEWGAVSPFGQPGDRLWVREAWGVVSHHFDESGCMVEWVPDRPATKIHEMKFGNGYYSGHVIYRADGSIDWCDDDGYEDGRSCWKPNIHMPRLACRILLEITDVRIERLNDISNDDAMAEGMDDGTSDAALAVGWFEKPRRAFRRLWEQIYGQESWEANPWVWVVEFKKVS